VKSGAPAGERKKTQSQERSQRRQRRHCSPHARDGADEGDWGSREHSRWRSS
jgi:hypothetical protein